MAVNHISKAITDIMPSGCKDCISFIDEVLYGNNFGSKVCGIKGIDVGDWNTRPDWCPLEVEPVKWWETAQTLGNTGEE